MTAAKKRELTQAIQASPFDSYGERELSADLMRRIAYENYCPLCAANGKWEQMEYYPENPGEFAGWQCPDCGWETVLRDDSRNPTDGLVPRAWAPLTW